ncbi:MAG: hypothetical protein GF365_03675 [Candidatus Buchananbacteria bacterium]|nr:hypothetical protein [Candidatus Buchananbacteria bacterium]
MILVTKTIKIIFVKPNNLGLLITDEALNAYNTLHKRAFTKYRKAMGLVENVKGLRVKVQYESIAQQAVKQEELDQQVSQIIMFKDDGTALLLKNEAFNHYKEHHFKGILLLQKSNELGQIPKIKGSLVKINSIQKGD